MRILLSYAYKPYTTAVYYERAFRAMGHEVTTCPPDDWAWATHDPLPDLFLWIEAGGGIRPRAIFSGILSCALYIDSHTQRTWHIPDARRYDHVFVADIRYVGEYGPNAHWLPMACDPELHTPTRTRPPEYDVAFVGHCYGDSPLYADRRRTLAELQKRYRCNFVEGVYFKDMADVYASARVAFNKSVMGELNMRVFEAACSGRPVVTDAVEGLDALEAPIGQYQDDIGMHAMISVLLKNHDFAGPMGDQWRRWALRHTYQHRAAEMLKAVGA